MSKFVFKKCLNYNFLAAMREILNLTNDSYWHYFLRLNTEIEAEFYEPCLNNKNLVAYFRFQKCLNLNFLASMWKFLYLNNYWCWHHIFLSE